MGWRSLKVTVDTNILIRAVMRDDAKQARAADTLLTRAEQITVTMPTLCEFVWVLRRLYGLSRSDICVALEFLLGAANVVADRPAFDAGLATLKAGGDFADGLIAWEGRWLGGETFLSFDKRAVTLLARQGHKAELLL